MLRSSKTTISTPVVEAVVVVEVVVVVPVYTIVTPTAHSNVTLRSTTPRTLERTNMGYKSLLLYSTGFSRPPSLTTSSLPACLPACLSSACMCPCVSVCLNSGCIGEDQCVRPVGQLCVTTDTVCSWCGDLTCCAAPVALTNCHLFSRTFLLSVVVKAGLVIVAREWEIVHQ